MAACVDELLDNGGGLAAPMAAPGELAAVARSMTSQDAATRSWWRFRPAGG